jgi:nucleotide-binding universal stress UspA family protein
MRVLVATDLSPAADVALHEGAALAAPGGALAVVHALPPLLDFWLPNYAGHLAKSSARASEALTQRVRSVLGSLPVELFVEDDVDYAAIIRRADAWKADTIVVGSHGGSGLARIFGGVAERVIRHAHCSVLVARSSGARGWVLAATDRSDASLPAITAAAEEAQRRKAQLEVVQAFGFLDGQAAYIIELGTPSVTPPPLVLESAARDLSECVARLHVHATCKILDRPAAAAIAHEAESLGAELVVVGARGSTGLASLGLGSVGEKVARASPCSVLVVRSRTG